MIWSELLRWLLTVSSNRSVKYPIDTPSLMWKNFPMNSKQSISPLPPSTALTPPACSTLGDACNEACDPKRMRVKTVENNAWCRKCRAFSGHRDGCEDDTIATANLRTQKAKEREKWARDRAEYWLNEVRKMHGKLALLKGEIRKLRARSNLKVCRPLERTGENAE